MNRFWLGACALAFSLSASYVIADYTVSQGTGTTIFAFTCFTSKVCPSHVNTNSAGIEIGTVANPLVVNPTGTTPQPVSQSGVWSVGLTGSTTVSGSVTANSGTNLNTSLLALETGGNLASISAWGVGQGTPTAAQKGLLGQCAVTSSTPSYTSAQTDPLSCDTSGNLRVNVTSATGLAQSSPTSGQSGSLVMGAATSAVPSYTTAQTNPISLDLLGNTRVAPSSSPSGGAIGYHLYSAASTNSTNVKPTTGTVYNLSIQNTNATVYYFKFYDKASAPTCNSDTPIYAVAVSGLATGYNTTVPFPTGLAFTNGIGFCITGAQADADNSNANTGMNISIAYK